MTHLEEAAVELATAKAYLDRAIEDLRWPNDTTTMLRDIAEAERQIAFAKNSVTAHAQS